MSQQAQIYLINEIHRAMNYCVDEYDITWVEAVGCLQMALHKLTERAVKETIDEAGAGNDSEKQDA